MNSPSPSNSVQLSEAEIQEKLRSLLHKEGTWVDWGKTCQELQKAGCNPADIFEASGFQASQQNIIIVASQVYDGIVQAELAPEVLTYYKGPKTDILYELRILNQKQRANAAQLAYDKKVDVDGAHEIARIIKDVSRMSQLPEGFTQNPGDMVAYNCWKHARQRKDLQERSRLIAKGLKFAYSQPARETIERLLSDFTVVASHTAPLLPIYRLDSEEELIRIVPLVGTYPLTRQDIEAVAGVEIQEPFRSVNIQTQGIFVPIPGWQAVLKAVDPVGYICNSDRLPKTLTGQVEQVLVIIDRAAQTWDVNSYFLLETADGIELQWSETEPKNSIIGQLVVVVRPKRILDEGNITEPWQMDD
ncbi:conserved hypothetical protein [Hyella patelloides LEGE 07179]|uniref:RuBisCO accumulation factor 1 n=1 Tax=Hyella patelloides LEGE 07179 TaxID=945734 RepID=A0A563VQB5_9CYAN|nr:RuBisCO accumulation factor 1 [Hyella patelloides]VEP13601.1 conserved hypothetical protein [Hyella patelloides LEGE 07179]